MASKPRLPPLSPTRDPRDYPLFTGGVSRWLWRVYTQRFTPAGRWFALATTVFVGYGGASLQLQGYVLAGYAGAVWLVAIAAALLYRPRVKLAAYVLPRVGVGETLQVDLSVEQRGYGRGADLVVVPHRLPPSIESVPADGQALPDLRKGQTAGIRLGLRCLQRGSYTLRGFRVETGFPFGILRARRLFAETRTLLVFPHFHPLDRLALPSGRRYQPGGVAMASQIGESFEYLGNREYREGDSVRDIDWRATARVNRPIVREWVEEYMLRAAVVLDTQVPKGLGLKAKKLRRDAFERAVAVAASVSEYMARQDYLVDILAAGPNLYHLTAGRGLAYLDQILDILACVQENPQAPFETIEPELAELLGRLSTVICVFLDWDAPRRSAALNLLAQGVSVKVIVVRDTPCSLDPAIDADLLGEVPIISKADFDRGINHL